MIAVMLHKSWFLKHNRMPFAIDCHDAPEVKVPEAEENAICDCLLMMLQKSGLLKHNRMLFEIDCCDAPEVWVSEAEENAICDCLLMMLQKSGLLKHNRMLFVIDCCDAPGQGLRSFTLFNTVIENAIKEEVVAECAGCRFLLPCLCQFLIVSHVSLLWFDASLISLEFSLSLSYMSVASCPFFTYAADYTTIPMCAVGH